MGDPVGDLVRNARVAAGWSIDTALATTGFDFATFVGIETGAYPCLPLQRWVRLTRIPGITYESLGLAYAARARSYEGRPPQRSTTKP